MEVIDPTGAVVLLAALGCALMAGLFFAFSVAVMKALAALPSAHGIAAMQSINVVILNRAFLGVFFGTALGCLVVVIGALTDWSGLRARFAIAAALLYVIGTVLVTVVFNVPRNDALARVEPTSAEGARLWADYLVGWTAWNHVRTAASLVSTACFVLALAVPNH